MLLVVPSDPLGPRKADAYFEADADAARRLGWNVGLVDVDAMQRGDIRDAVSRIGGISGDRFAYRGWMLTTDQYASLCREGRERNLTPHTSPEQYRLAHEFPGWYRQFTELTSTSVWSTGTDPDTVVRLAASLPAGSGVLKDWVKSMKHHWHDACFVTDVHDDRALRSVLRRFVELRGADLVGGIVIRSWEDYRPGETRTWWVDGTCVAVSAHPDHPNHNPDTGMDLTQVAAAVTTLGTPFITVDLAATRTGELRVVELGDGQVSDRPPGLDPGTLFSALTP